MIASTGTNWPRSIEELIPAELSARLDRIDVMSRRVFAGKLQGERRSKRRGRGVEFEDHRAYVHGDDLRHIDWHVFARLDRFFVKIFQEEEDLAFHVFLDASRSMDSPGSPTGWNKLVFGARLAMALGYVSLVNNNRVSVSVYDGRALHRLEPVRGRRAVQRLGAFLLERARPAGGVATGAVEGDGATAETDWSGALRALARARTGKGVMIVISDFLITEGYGEGLKLLAGVGGAGMDTYCLQVLSPGELDPAVERSGTGESAQGESGKGRGGVPVMLGDLRLTDVETGRSAEVTLTPALIARYRQTVRAYIEELRQFCAARSMTHVLLPSDTDVSAVLLDSLRKRGLLR